MRLLARILMALVALTALVLLAGYLVLRGSLPMLDGERAVTGLAAAASIERDELGVATIHASGRHDAAFATGFVHAQERFFQMDLQRRVGAGELAALLGPAALGLDRANRLHRFRHRARRLVSQLADDEVRLYRAYTAGVNAGLAALAARPFEYYLLGSKPQRWADEDILLTVFSMYFELNDENASRESELAVLRERLPDAYYRWLIQSGTDWDAPLRGGAIPAVPLPGPDVVDLRAVPVTAFRNSAVDETPPLRPGSNNWAVAAHRTASGHALLAGDMHLGHAVPNIWFRARLVIGDELDVSGVTLPGTPLVVAGSNGQVAWSFTNSYGDWEDLVLLETDAARPDHYRTPAGWRQFDETVEPIEVRGGETIELTVRETIWGPVLDRDASGRLRALHWLAHAGEATNIGIAAFEQVSSVAAALDAANRVGAPPQNFVAVDVNGHIGWTIMGKIPRRVGIDPLLPSSWADGAGWQGWVRPQDYPRILDPPDGLLWTANGRTVDGDWLALLGEGDFPVGARPAQIRDGLRARQDLTVADMLAIQLDDRAVFLSRWRDLLLRLLTPGAVAEDPLRGDLRELAGAWGGHAATDSAGYRLVRAFRLAMIQRVTAMLLAPLRPELPGVQLRRHSQLERPVWQVINDRPAHLLSPEYASWEQFFLAVIDSTIDHFSQFEGTLADRTWGEVNTIRIAHPLTRGVPLLSRWLNMPAEPLPGDENMPRVQAASFGASQRMAVSPGHESGGYFHMPGGQSGHPLSPFYGAGHASWARGEQTPFLPGEAVHRLVLRPAASP